MLIFVIMNMENTIKSLLYHYDCVIVPDFGGFVAKRKSAIFHPIDYKFEPPKKIVGFNSDLIYTDGLLANEFARQNKISYQEALELIEQEVAHWKSTLDNNQTITVPSLGVLSKNKNVIEFQPADNQNFALESFGLAPLRSNYILRSKKDTTVSKKSNAWVSYAAAIGFALLVGGSGFLANQNLVQNQLSSVLPLLNTNTIEEVPVTPIAPVIDLNTINDEVVEANDPQSDVGVNLPVESTSNIGITEVETLTENIDLSVKKYQVIGGSFKVYSRAMEHQAKLKRDGYERAIIVGKVGNYFMVAFDTFHDKTAAANYKRELEKKGIDVFMRP